MMSEHHAASSRSLDLGEEGIALKAIVETRMALCECGCGQPVPMAKHTYSRTGQVKGQPVRFVPGHSGRGAPALDRIFALVTEVGAPEDLGPLALPCWLVSPNRKDGRRRIRVNSKDVFAYHVTYEEFIGPFPGGLVPDHLCCRPACVNPWHLDPVPGRVNSARGTGPTAENSRKEVCQNGHLLTEDNVRIETGGRRRCRTCVREYSHEAYLRQKEGRRAA